VRCGTGVSGGEENDIGGWLGPGSRRITDSVVPSWPGPRGTDGPSSQASAHFQATKQAKIGSREPRPGLATQPNTPYEISTDDVELKTWLNLVGTLQPY
jgi:hypothetical protein